MKPKYIWEMQCRTILSWWVAYIGALLSGALLMWGDLGVAITSLILLLYIVVVLFILISKDSRIDITLLNTLSSVLGVEAISLFFDSGNIKPSILLVIAVYGAYSIFVFYKIFPMMNKDKLEKKKMGK